jgi:hypothetical protein
MIIPFKNLFQIPDWGIQILAAVFFAGSLQGHYYVEFFRKNGVDRF